MYRVFVDIVNNSRMWRLWAIRPKVYMIPYAFDYPSLDNLTHKYERI